MRDRLRDFERIVDEMMLRLGTFTLSSRSTSESLFVTDVNVAFHNAVETRVVDSAGLFAHETFLELHFWAAENARR